LDGGAAGIRVETGVKTLNAFMVTLAESAGWSLHIDCSGNLWVDEHHTAEDVAIVLGQVVTQALGTKAGLNRMWSLVVDIANDKSGSRIEATVELSNRPCQTHNLKLNIGTEQDMIGDLSVEMFEHVLDSFVVN